MEASIYREYGLIASGRLPSKTAKYITEALGLLQSILKVVRNSFPFSIPTELYEGLTRL